VNLLAPLKITHALLPAMIARRGGTIVDVASVAALAPPPGMLFYSASKAGLAAASESLRAELRGTGVHVVTVYPGPVHTDMGHRSAERMEPTLGARVLPWGRPEELAGQIAAAVERRRPRVIYPAFYGLSRWLGPVARWLTERGGGPKR
jgi:short-subunit dehydrogenase